MNQAAYESIKHFTGWLCSLENNMDVDEETPEGKLDKTREVVVELLQEVVEEVVGDSWISGMREEEEEQKDSQLKCDTCDKSYSTKRLLYFHQRNQQVDPGNCNFCSKHLTIKVKLKNYIHKIHTFGPKKQPIIYLSETCGIFFRDRSNLSQHMGYSQKVLDSRKPVPKFISL